jgi:hypothetical protein
MEVVGVVFIASNHFLSVAPFLPTADGLRLLSGQSAPAHQWLKSQRLVVMSISTAIMHLMRHQMSNKVVADGLAVHPRGSARTLKMNFTEPVTVGFFWFYNDRMVRAWGRMVLACPGRFSLLLRTVRSVNSIFAVFLSEAHPGVADGPTQGPQLSAHMCFSKKLLLSRIIYGISDSSLRIVVDELMHLRMID